jgi:hypothetical protein
MVNVPRMADSKEMATRLKSAKYEEDLPRDRGLSGAFGVVAV